MGHSLIKILPSDGQAFAVRDGLLSILSVATNRVATVP